MGPYKTITAAYNALKKGFKKQTKRDPNPIEEEMIMEEAKTKITSQGENISTLDTGIMTQASGTKPIDEVVEFTKSKEDVVQDLVDRKFGKGYFDKADETQFFKDVDEAGGMEAFLDANPIPGPGGNITKKIKPDLDRPFVTDEQMSAFTMDENARKLNKAKGIINNLGAKTTKQKLFVADLVEDAGQGIFDTVDMGAVVRSNMFDDLVDQLDNDDLVMKIMYSGTKSDDFGITMAKIKSNAMDEGVDISDTVDFYERTFNEVVRPKKADGGRMGFATGTPKGIMKLVDMINKKFGKGAMKTADEIDQPEKTTQQLISEFESRTKPREILDVPEVPKGFKLSREKLKQNFPELDEDMIDQMIEMEPDLQGRVIKMLENRRIDPDSYDKLLMEKGDTLEFQGEFDKVTRRKKNASGGLPHILGV